MCSSDLEKADEQEMKLETDEKESGQEQPSQPLEEMVVLEEVEKPVEVVQEPESHSAHAQTEDVNTALAEQPVGLEEATAEMEDVEKAPGSEEQPKEDQMVPEDPLHCEVSQAPSNMEGSPSMEAPETTSNAEHAVPLHSLEDPEAPIGSDIPATSPSTEVPEAPLTSDVHMEEHAIDAQAVHLALETQAVDSTPENQVEDLTPADQVMDSTPENQVMDPTIENQVMDPSPEVQAVDLTPEVQEVDPIVEVQAVN